MERQKPDALTVDLFREGRPRPRGGPRFGVRGRAWHASCFFWGFVGRSSQGRPGRPAGRRVHRFYSGCRMETLKAAGPSPSGGRREKEQRLKAELVGRMAAFEAARAGEAGEALTLRVAETLERLGCPSLWLDRKGR